MLDPVTTARSPGVAFAVRATAASASENSAPPWARPMSLRWRSPSVIAAWAVVASADSGSMPRWAA
jgi:hypothetical protein